MKIRNSLTDLQLFLVALVVALLFIPGYGFHKKVLVQANIKTFYLSLFLDALAVPLFVYGARKSERNNHTVLTVLNTLFATLILAWIGFLGVLLLTFGKG
jgi:hypothetical protein